MCCQSVQVETSPWTLGKLLKYRSLKLKFYHIRNKVNADGIRILAGSVCGCVSAPLLVHIHGFCLTLSAEGDFIEARLYRSQMVLQSGSHLWC